MKELILKYISKTNWFNDIYTRNKFIELTDSVSDKIIEYWYGIKYHENNEYRQKLYDVCKLLQDFDMSMNKNRTLKLVWLEWTELNDLEHCKLEVYTKYHMFNEQDINIKYLQEFISKDIYNIIDNISDSSKDLYKYIFEEL